jgi:hypothetical protein
VEMVRTIEAVSQMSITGLVSNTHLMAETTLPIIRDGYDQAAQTAERIGLPLLAVAVDEAAAADLDGTAFNCPIMILRRIVRPPFEQSRKAKQSGPLFTLN